MTDHVMVIPNGGPVRIGDSPTIETRGAGLCGWSMENGHPAEVVVNGVKIVFVDSPWPAPSPIPETPYEAYAYAAFPMGWFAIRLRTELHEPDACPDGTSCAFHDVRHVHPTGLREDQP